MLHLTLREQLAYTPFCSNLEVYIKGREENKGIERWEEDQSSEGNTTLDNNHRTNVARLKVVNCRLEYYEVINVLPAIHL